MGVNGFALPDGSPDSIKLALENIVERREALLKTALENRETASQRYRTSIFNARLRAIIESPVSENLVARRQSSVS